MKKVILAALAGVFTLSLVGCEQRVATEKTPGETTSTTILKDETTPSTTTTPSVTTPSTPTTPTPSTMTTPDSKTSVDVNIKPEEKPAQ